MLSAVVKRLPVILCLLLFAVMVTRTAWVCDDAYITLRTIDNVLYGYGLTWNAAERVQTYSHPLWMFVLTVAYVVTHESYLTIIIVSMLVSFAAVLLFAFKIAPSRRAACLGVISFSLSKSFVDFSTSGLENPLSHLLLALFLITYIRQANGSRAVFLLSLLTSLIMLVRLDLVLLVGPALTHRFWSARSRSSILALAAGFSLFILWELFSLVYYGFPFPNPAYAKLGTGLPQWDILAQGAHYLESVLRADRLLVGLVLATAGYALFRWKRGLWPEAVGLVLYLAYIVWIGGCFMVGRFFTAPLFMAVSLGAMIGLGFRTRTWIILYGLVILLGVTSRYAPLYSSPDFGSNRNQWGFGYGVDDERLGYFQQTGLVTGSGWRVRPTHKWVDDGEYYRSAGTPLVTAGGVGLVGYYAGPKTHIVDFLALGDPLLARLPCVYDMNWRQGHFLRQTPEGYLETLRTGINKIRDPFLAAYYDTLCVITRGSIGDLQRLRIILAMNLGRYDYLLERAEPVMLEANLADYSTPRPAGAPWHHREHLRIPTRGVRINIGDVSYARHINVSLDGNDDYRFIFMRERHRIDSLTITSTDQSRQGLVIYQYAIPAKAARHGFDAIIIVPSGADRKYALGHILLQP